jgi:enoyl-CoA hydratase/carnithine racemase
LESTILDVARTIAANAPLTLTAAKAAIDRAAGLAEPNAPDPKALADACFDSADYREGRLAFRQKRQPVFTGP